MHLQNNCDFCCSLFLLLDSWVWWTFQDARPLSALGLDRLRNIWGFHHGRHFAGTRARTKGRCHDGIAWVWFWCVEHGQYCMASEARSWIRSTVHWATGSTWPHANHPLCMHGPLRYCTRHMYEFIYEHFIIRWCPEAYGQWTLDSSMSVDEKSRMLQSFGEAKTMVVEARKKGTWVLLQNCHLYKKLGWHCSPCFTQLHILTQAPHHPCCLLLSNSPSLLAVRQSRLHTYSRLFKLAVLAIDYYLLSFLTSTFHLLPYSSTDPGKRSRYY